MARSNRRRDAGGKRSGPDIGQKIHSSSRKTGDQPQVYEAVCSVCGKKTYVPFQPDGKRAIYCKLHRNAGQQARLPDGQVQHQKPEVFSGVNVRTMNSSFQKSPDLGEETIHLSELGRHKKSRAEIGRAPQSSRRSFG